MQLQKVSVTLWFRQLQCLVLLLQPLWWCCVDCVIHHEWDVREEYYVCGVYVVYVVRTSNNRVIPMEWSWWVTSNNACEPGEQLIVLANGDNESDLVGWSLLLLAATVRSSAHMPLGISDRNTTFCFVCFYRPVVCRVCVFILWASCLLINKYIKLKYKTGWCSLPYLLIGSASHKTVLV